MSFRHRSFCAAAMAAFAVSAASAGAETQPATPVTGGWQEGFFVQSADGGSRLNFTLVAQLDGRFVVSDGTEVLVQPFRRARNPGSLNALGFALGASHGTQRLMLPSFQTSVGQRYFTGETGADPGVPPHASFDPASHSYGALQLEGGLVPDRDPEDAIVFRGQVAF